jgi:hypothetical protein
MVLPSFLICGAHKAGTTALYKFLRQHPEVLMSEPKETGFFHAHYEEGWDWLASHFGGYDGHNAIGEASTLTMASEQAPARIAEEIPEAQLIFVLRDPVERAYSHYYYHLYTGKAATPASFDELIRDKSSDFRNEILRLGRYDRQIPRFDNYFSRDQMKIILQEDLRTTAEETVRCVFKFIGVDPTFRPATGRHNTTKHPSSPRLYYWLRQAWQPLRTVAERFFPGITETIRTSARNTLLDQDRPEMKRETQRYLAEYYQQTTQWTEERIGCELLHWIPSLKQTST